MWTPYGLGILANYRAIDDKFEVLLVWGATCYSHRDSVVQLTDPVHTVSYVRIMRSMLKIEEKEKEEKRKKEEFLISEQKELELRLKRRVIHLKEFQDNKLKMEKAMKLILNKAAIPLSDKNSEIASNLIFESALSPERKKRLSILPAISRALSPLNMIRLDPITTFNPTITNNRTNSKDELTFIGKNLDSIILKNLTLSPSNTNRNNSNSNSNNENLSGNDNNNSNFNSNSNNNNNRFRGESTGVNVVPQNNDKNENFNSTIVPEGSSKTSTSTSTSSSIFSRGWMHWPSSTSNTTSNTTSSTSSNTPKNVSSLWGFTEKTNPENPSIKENEYVTYSSITKTYVNIPYGMGTTQHTRPVYHIHTSDSAIYLAQNILKNNDSTLNSNSNLIPNQNQSQNSSLNAMDVDVDVDVPITTSASSVTADVTVAVTVDGAVDGPKGIQGSRCDGGGTVMEMTATDTVLYVTLY